MKGSLWTLYKTNKKLINFTFSPLKPGLNLMSL